MKFISQFNWIRSEGNSFLHMNQKYSWTRILDIEWMPDTFSCGPSVIIFVIVVITTKINECLLCSRYFLSNSYVEVLIPSNFQPHSSFIHCQNNGSSSESHTAISYFVSQVGFVWNSFLVFHWLSYLCHFLICFENNFNLCIIVDVHFEHLA